MTPSTDSRSRVESDGFSLRSAHVSGTCFTQTTMFMAVADLSVLRDRDLLPPSAVAGPCVSTRTCRRRGARRGGRYGKPTHPAASASGYRWVGTAPTRVIVPVFSQPVRGRRGVRRQCCDARGLRPAGGPRYERRGLRLAGGPGDWLDRGPARRSAP